MPVKKNVIGAKAPVFGGGDEVNQATIDLNAHLAEHLRGKEGAKIIAKPVDIYAIVPDPTQPRRAVPSALRGYDYGQLWDAWLLMAEQEREGARDLIGSIIQGQDVERPESMGAIETPLLEIADLASSIARDGLTNPITIVRAADYFQIETGERRWLAYHLLYAYRQDEQWLKIPAREVPGLNRWRQAAENNVRANLNAIGKARQFAVLLMDLLGVEHFAPFETFENEQQFYAQVSDARIPHGKNEVMLNAMGYKHRNAFSRCRALLKLPGELWQVGDDENWSEDRLLNTSTEEIVPTRNNSNIPNDPPTPPRQQYPLAETVGREARKFSKRVHKWYETPPSDDDERQMTLEYLNSLEQEIQAAKKWLEG